MTSPLTLLPLARLFASPFCGPADLVEEWTDGDNGVIEGEGTFYDVAGCNPGLTPELPSFRFPAFECRARDIAAAVGGGIMTHPGVFPRTPRVPPTSIAACADVLPRTRRD